MSEDSHFGDMESSPSPSLADTWRAGRHAGAVPALPRLPVLGNLLEFRKDRLAMQAKLAALGPIARFHIGPIAIHAITDAAMVQEVLVDQADAFGKSRGLSVFARPLLGQGLLTSEGLDHRRARKLMAPAFAARRISGYAQVMAAEAARTAAAWDHGAHVDLAEDMMAMTLAIAGRTLFDADVRGDARAVAVALTDAMQAMIDGLTSPLQVPYAWPLPRHQRMRKAVAELDRIVYRIIRARRASTIDRGDVLSILLVARDDDGQGLSDVQIRDEVMTLLLAGHETTANLLTWTFYALGRHPEIRARVEAEIDRVLGGRPPTADDLPRLPYTLAVLEETMRLWPPAHTIGRAALRDVTIGGRALAKGATVMLNIHAMHRRGDYFPDPLRFDPERMTPEAKKARPKGAYLPFGAGPRVCIGNHFALMEAQLAVAAIVGQARIELRSAAPAEPEPLVTLRPRGGLPVRIVRRVRGESAA
jgi:cytochrome P450